MGKLYPSHFRGDKLASLLPTANALSRTDCGLVLAPILARHFPRDLPQDLLDVGCFPGIAKTHSQAKIHLNKIGRVEQEDPSEDASNSDQGAFHADEADFAIEDDSD